jgi:hypothetical protein
VPLSVGVLASTAPAVGESALQAAKTAKAANAAGMTKRRRIIPATIPATPSQNLATGPSVRDR